MGIGGPVNMTFASCFNFARALCSCSVADYTLEKNDFFRVFVNVFYIRRSCRRLVDCAVLDCPHNLYDMQAWVFVAFWSTLKSVFKNGQRISVDGLAKTHRNERFFQRSAVAWTGPFDDGLLWSFSFHIERCLFSFLDQFGFQFSNKLVRNNVSKDNSLHQYLVLNILPNPLWVTLTKNFWGKSPPPISLFIYYSLKFKLVPLLNS